MGSNSVQPMPMEGGGAYNRSSRVQAAGLHAGVEMFEAAAREVLLSSLLLIADYGASQGRNSLLPIGAARAVLRERAGAAPISVVHTDLPDNDFSSLFRTLATDSDSYARADPNVFPSAVGRSFYGVVLPPESVTLGWSSWAVQWLSRVPAVIPDQVQVAYSRDAAAHQAFADQAAADWRAFLTSRSREMRSGGRLVIVTMATDDAGDFGYCPLLKAVYAALEEMVAAGFLGAEELREMAIPTVGRMRDEWQAPFEGGLFEGLSLETLDLVHEEDRIWTRYEASRDAAAFGAEWAAFSRASVFPTLAAAVAGGTDTRATQFVERLETDVAAKLAAAPQPMTISLAVMAIVKRV